MFVQCSEHACCGGFEIEDIISHRCQLSDISRTRTYMAGVFLLTILPRSHAWERMFGDCMFYGADEGGALNHSGLCSDLPSSVHLTSMGITSVPANSFKDMGSIL